jgi:integrase
MQIIDHRPTYGPEFRQASVSDIRKDRQRKRAEHGAPMFTAEQVRKLIDSAGVPLKAMILLGINAGMGQGDCSELRETHIDLDAGVLDYPRPKTGIERRAILWPETVEAIRKAQESRPKPTGDTPANSVFITRHGRTWIRHSDKGTNIDSVSTMFNKLLVALKIKRPGLAFYSLRRTFETVAGETTDQPAVDRVMGHEDANRMSTRYTVKIGDDRLKAVCDHVWAWLKPKATKGKKKSKAATSKRSKSTDKSKAKTDKPKLRLVG